jgi:hypothetical protein
LEVKLLALCPPLETRNQIADEWEKIEQARNDPLHHTNGTVVQGEPEPKLHDPFFIHAQDEMDTKRSEIRPVVRENLSDQDRKTVWTDSCSVLMDTKLLLAKSKRLCSLGHAESEN